MTGLRSLHRLSAAALALFLVAHVVNHVAAIFGMAAHQQVMAILRLAYRQPWLEPILLLLVAWQTATGLTLITQKWRAKLSAVAKFQALCGLYLALFLAIHVGAVIYGRQAGLDTDFRFAAAGFHVQGWTWFFAPYYFFAMLALFGHVGCVFYWQMDEWSLTRRNAVLKWTVGAGALLGVLIVLSLSGPLFKVDIPATYFEMFI